MLLLGELYNYLRNTRRLLSVMSYFDVSDVNVDVSGMSLDMNHQ